MKTTLAVRLFDEPSDPTISLSLLRPEARSIELCAELQRTCRSLDLMIERVSVVALRSFSNGTHGSAASTPPGHGRVDP